MLSTTDLKSTPGGSTAPYTPLNLKDRKFTAAFCMFSDKIV